MTRKEFKKIVAQSAKSVLYKYSLMYRDIKFTNLPTLAIGDEFFAQGESASELIDSCPNDINLRTWLLYYLESAGAL